VAFRAGRWERALAPSEQNGPDAASPITSFKPRVRLVNPVVRPAGDALGPGHPSVDPKTMEAKMNDFSYAIDRNIERFQKLLETSVNETQKQIVQSLLTEERAKAAALQASGPQKE
jgi:hypothetical protein